MNKATSFENWPVKNYWKPKKLRVNVKKSVSKSLIENKFWAIQSGFTSSRSEQLG